MNRLEDHCTKTAPPALPLDTDAADPLECAQPFEAEVEVLDTVQVGLDDGYAFTKLVLPNDRLVAIPSRARIGQAGVTWIEAEKQRVFEYSTEGSIYSVGSVDGDSTRFTGYPISGLHRCIIQHALQQARLGGRSVHVVSGLPVSAFYFSDGQQRSAAIQQKRDTLKTAVEPVSSGGMFDRGRPPVSVAFHEVIPEALAAWYDQVIEVKAGEASVNTERVEKPVAVVDIGGRTTDYVVVENQGILHRSSGSLSKGMLDVHSQGSQRIQKQFNLESVSEQRVAQAVKRGTVRLHGREHDVAEIVRQAKLELVTQLHSETRRQLGLGETLDTIIFVGGGSAALASDIAHWFPNQEIAEQPAFANARGMLKYLRYVCEEPTSSHAS
ncbi:MAG: plasmid segregation protein ParM [Halieaceae bacterium]|jgi:plasmid segregation protein ParM